MRFRSAFAILIAGASTVSAQSLPTPNFGAFPRINGTPFNSVFATTSGTFIQGHCRSTDSQNNEIDSGSACGSSSGTVGTGTSGQLPVYGGSNNISGTTTGAGVVTAISSGTNAAGGLLVGPAPSSMINFTAGVTETQQAKNLLSVAAQDWGASGSANHYTTNASTFALATTIPLPANDFVAGQGMLIVGAGDAPISPAPTSVVASWVGSAFGPTLTAAGAISNASPTVQLKAGACPIQITSGIDGTITVIDTSAGNVVLGTVKDCNVTTTDAVTLNSNSLSNGFGSTDAIAFQTTYTYRVSGLDARQTDSQGGFEQGGITLATVSNTLTAPLLTDTQDYVLLTISRPSDAVGSASVTAGTTLTASVSNAAITGPGNILTVSVQAGNPIVIGSRLSGANLGGVIKVTADSSTNATLTGAGGAGTYRVGKRLNVASESMVANSATISVPSVSGSITVGQQLWSPNTPARPPVTVLSSAGGSNWNINASIALLNESVTFFNPAPYAIWRSVGGAASYFVNTGGWPTYRDTGYCAGGNCVNPTEPFGIPATPPISAVNNWAVRAISSMSGNNAIVSLPLPSATSSVYVEHNSTAQINAALAANPGAIVRLPCPNSGGANYIIDGPINLGTKGVGLTGDSWCTTLTYRGGTDIVFMGQTTAPQVKYASVANLFIEAVDQYWGRAVVADFVNHGFIDKIFLDAPFDGFDLENFNNIHSLGPLRVNRPRSQYYRGIFFGVDRSTAAANGIMSGNDMNVQGNNGQDWPDASGLAGAYQMDGPTATLSLHDYQCSHPSGFGRYADDLIGTTGVPLDISFSGYQCEFVTNNATDWEDGLRINDDVPQSNGAGYHNFVDCATSADYVSNIFRGNSSVVVSGGFLSGATGNNLYVNGNQAVFNGTSYFTASTPGYGGTVGQCDEVHFGPNAINDALNGGYSGNNANRTWGASPALIEAGATNIGISNQVFAGTVSLHPNNQAPPGSGVVISCNVGSDVNDCLSTVTPSVQALGQTGIPFIRPGTFTVANNGALTLGVALPGPPNFPLSAYVHVGAAVIAASGTGSAAGWYYATFSDSTHCSLFNNTYSSGNPTVPASPTAFVTTAGAFVSDTGQLITLSVPVAANKIGPNDGFKVTAEWSFTGSTNSKAGEVSLAGVLGNVGTALGSFSTASGTQQSYYLGSLVTRNRGVTGQQITGPGLNTGLNTSLPNYPSIDMTAISYVNFETTAASTDVVVLEAATVTYLPAAP